MRVRRCGWCPVACGVLTLVVVLFAGAAVTAEEVGGLLIVLQATRYVKPWDVTVLTYRVRNTWHPHDPTDASWVLATGECMTGESVHPSGTPFEWTDAPFHGMHFDVTAANEHVYVWLYGRWETAATELAVVRIDEETGDEQVYVGSIDGPACEGTTISLEVTEGAHVSFPAPAGPGTFAAEEDTALRISSTTSGWALGHTLEFSIPEEASRDTVERVFQVHYDALDPGAGTTELGVSYALELSEEDFAGLPQGMYTIAVTFTASTD